MLNGMPQRAIRAIGSTGYAPAALTGLAALTRGGIVPDHIGHRAVALLVASWSERMVAGSLDLGAGRHARLDLDLGFDSCIDLLTTPLWRLPDQTAIRLFRAAATGASTIFDVGANVGLFTYLAAADAPRARIYAYEPNPPLAALITRNLKRNGWSGRSQVRAEGVGALPGHMTFYVLESDSESTFDGDAARQGTIVRELSVPVVALDDVLEQELIDAANAVMKIDVEGHEMRVLDGLERTLRVRGRRPLMLMEFLGRAIQHERVIDRVLGFGLSVYYLSSRGLVHLASTDDLQPVHELGHWNFLLTDRTTDEVRQLAGAAGLLTAGL